MFENMLNHNYKTCNGVQIFDDFGADIGLTLLAGNKLKFAVDGWFYKNFSISGDVFEGDEGSYNEGVWGWTFGCVLGTSADGDAIGIECDIPEEYGDNTKRIALYLAEGGSNDNTYVYFAGVIYDTVNNSFSYGLPIPNVELTSSVSMFQIGTPFNTTPGLVRQLTASVYHILQDGCNTIRGTAPADYLGHFYNMTNIATNIPLFDTLEHAKDYLEHPDHLTGLLNQVEADPEDDYSKQFDFYYIKECVGHNTRNVISTGNTKVNLRFFPKTKGIAFIQHTPTASEPWDRELVKYNGYTAYSAPWGVDDDEEFTQAQNFPTHYLSSSISFGMNDYYTKFEWDSNILMFRNMQEVEDFYNGIIGPENALNYDYISRIDNTVNTPDMPGLDQEKTSFKTNGMQYGYGCRLYAITNLELASLFNELFDPANLQDILDGNKLFGQDGISQSITGILYLPLTDLSDICELGNLANIKIGSWQSSQAQGKRINNNDKIIDCGTFTFTPTYRDFRDFSPYTKLYIATGFWGFHELDIAKYYNKTINVKVAIDVTTGATCLQLIANGMLMDVFQGTCGASRPFVATDNNAYMNNIISAISGATNNAAGNVSGVASAVGDAGQLASAGGAVGAVGGVAGVAVAGAGVVGSGIFAGYNIKNAVDNPPQMTRGNLSGNLAYYSANKINFVVAQKRTIRPENELSTIGYPSGHGGKIRQFSGYLKASAVKFSNFSGTKAELAELMSILSQGIYL